MVRVVNGPSFPIKQNECQIQNLALQIYLLANMAYVPQCARFDCFILFWIVVRLAERSPSQSKLLNSVYF